MSEAKPGGIENASRSGFGLYRSGYQRATEGLRPPWPPRGFHKRFAFIGGRRQAAKVRRLATQRRLLRRKILWLLSECGASIVGVGVLDDPRAIRESPLQKRGEIPVAHIPLALPMGELSPQVTAPKQKTNNSLKG